VPIHRRSRRQQVQEEPAWDAPRYPTLTATWQNRSEADIAASHARARLLLTGGWEALEDWLLADLTTEEIKTQQRIQESQRARCAFDAVP
jgi:hypothetical protein